MAQRILKIIEQDDPIVSLANDTAVDVLLRGNAVYYLVWGQDEGVAVFYVEEDVRARGLGRDEILETAQPIAQAALPELLGRYEQVWHF